MTVYNTCNDILSVLIPLLIASVIIGVFGFYILRKFNQFQEDIRTRKVKRRPVTIGSDGELYEVIDDEDVDDISHDSDSTRSFRRQLILALLALATAIVSFFAAGPLITASFQSTCNIFNTNQVFAATIQPTTGFTPVPTLTPTSTSIPPTLNPTLDPTLLTFVPPTQLPTTLAPTLDPTLFTLIPPTLFPTLDPTLLTVMPPPTPTQTPTPTFGAIVLAPSPTLANSNLCIVTPNRDANIRSKPGTAGSFVVTAPAGAQFIAIGQSLASTQGIWWQIANGWIADRVVTTSGNCSDVPVISITPDESSAPQATQVPANPQTATPIIPPTNAPQSNYVNGGPVNCGDSLKGNFTGDQPPNNFYTISMNPESELVVSYKVIAGDSNHHLAIAIFPPSAKDYFIGGGKTDAIAYNWPSPKTISSGKLAGGTYMIGVGSGYGGNFGGYGIIDGIYTLSITCR